MKKRKIYSECVNAKIARNQSGKRWQAVFVYALDAHGIKGYELKKHFFMPGGEVDKAHPFVSACVKKAGELLDRAEEPIRRFLRAMLPGGGGRGDGDHRAGQSGSGTYGG